MAEFQVVFKLNPNTAIIQEKGDKIPDGYTKVGEFIHQNAADDLGDNPTHYDDPIKNLASESHVYFQHVQDILYRVSAITGQAVANALVFPDNITDLSTVTILLDEFKDVDPVATTKPTITGTAKVGVELSGSNGVWNPGDGVTFTYKWEIGDAATGPWAPISGATTNKYTPVTANAGKFLRFSVTATRGLGSAEDYSVATAAIAAADG